MQKLEIGKLLKEGITWYKEGIKFDINDSGCDLYIYFLNSTSSEIESIKTGDLKVGYYSDGNVIFMLFKFGSMQWMDAPYSVHLSKNLTEFQKIEDGQGLSLHVYLVDANTGILQVTRLIGLKNKFSLQLIEVIEKQKLLTFDNYEENMNNIMDKYTTKNLISYGTLMF